MACGCLAAAWRLPSLAPLGSPFGSPGPRPGRRGLKVFTVALPASVQPRAVTDQANRG
jgi:hypothetical protein